MSTLIITEKSSQAKDLRAALGSRFGQILPAEGHLLRLAEPEEVDPNWKRWSPTLLKPAGLFPTKPDSGGNKTAKLKAILAALKSADHVILATDCDREGQLIGQEILEHARYRGTVQRALFTAQDPKTIRDAFARLKPNAEMRPLYEAAVARQQADQIFNLSLTRTATKILVPAGVRGVIGIGRVKTPTLAIVCMRELEIRNFKPEDYFEIVVRAEPLGGPNGGPNSGDISGFIMRHAPAAKDRIKDRQQAEAIAAAARDHQGRLTVTVEEKRQGPPKLYDLPALQKTCGQRWGWTADHTLAVAQSLYDGEGKKLITYPRAEARYLAESQIGDVPTITSALTRLRGFAHLDVSKPVIRRGKSGHFSDKGLEGVSHHAVVPNVNVLGDLEQRLARLSDDEKRLFALICRSYLAAVMPDYEYRQTVITTPVPVNGKPVFFRAVGRIPLKLGWKAVFASAEEKDSETEDEQTLPPLTNGQDAILRDPKIEAKRTQAPPRYNEGTLVDAMQNAWRFVEDPALRERLKEAKGIGTPATRAEIIKGLKRQNFLDSMGKLVVPTAAGLQLFETLKAAAPPLVDPGTTALWEMRLDEVVLGQANFRAVIDDIASEADRLIGVLVGQRGSSIALTGSNGPASFRKGGYGKAAAGKGATTRRATTRKTAAAKTNADVTDAASDAGEEVAPKRAPRKRTATATSRKSSTGGKSSTASKTATSQVTSHAAADSDAGPPPTPARAQARSRANRKAATPASAVSDAVAIKPAFVRAKPVIIGPVGSRPPRAPTEKMQAFAQDLARRKGVALPERCLEDFDTCRKFLDSQT